jgi:hypothetical protein
MDIFERNLFYGKIEDGTKVSQDINVFQFLLIYLLNKLFIFAEKKKFPVISKFIVVLGFIELVQSVGKNLAFKVFDELYSLETHEISFSIK